jgi:hypothetical protein
MKNLLFQLYFIGIHEIKIEKNAIFAIEIKKIGKYGYSS